VRRKAGRVLLISGLTTVLLAPAAVGAEYATAVFAGGCFWCMETAFEGVPGVSMTLSGYCGGKVENPSYEQVSGGRTGHAESVQVIFDPVEISYEKLLEIFWHNIDPLTPDAQFCDQGTQYRSAIFYANDTQKNAALASQAAIEKSGRLHGAIVTQIVPAGPFYAAEDDHQDFYKKNPLRYKLYRTGCGRDARLKELWGKDAGTHLTRGPG
jgi:peptide-methionine (S)-S-oxide reductase